MKLWRLVFEIGYRIFMDLHTISVSFLMFLFHFIYHRKVCHEICRKCPSVLQKIPIPKIIFSWFLVHITYQIDITNSRKPLNVHISAPWSRIDPILSVLESEDLSFNLRPHSTRFGAFDQFSFFGAPTRMQGPSSTSCARIDQNFTFYYSSRSYLRLHIAWHHRVKNIFHHLLDFEK